MAHVTCTLALAAFCMLTKHRFKTPKAFSEMSGGRPFCRGLAFARLARCSLTEFRQVVYFVRKGTLALDAINALSKRAVLASSSKRPSSASKGSAKMGEYGTVWESLIAL